MHFTTLSMRAHYAHTAHGGNEKETATLRAENSEKKSNRPARNAHLPLSAAMVAKRFSLALASG
ncbi:hypothetical protein L0Y41_01250, partial [bacterium]|nr:hypothetical protein [bacterium]